MNEIKTFQKRAFGIVTTGVGLSALAGVGDSSTAPVISKMGNALGTVGSLSIVDLQLSLLSKYSKKKKLY